MSRFSRHPSILRGSDRELRGRPPFPWALVVGCSVDDILAYTAASASAPTTGTTRTTIRTTKVQVMCQFDWPRWQEARALLRQDLAEFCVLTLRLTLPALPDAPHVCASVDQSDHNLAQIVMVHVPSASFSGVLFFASFFNLSPGPYRNLMGKDSSLSRTANPKPVSAKVSHWSCRFCVSISIIVTVAA